MIKVIISGKANTGKSTVALIIEKALQDAGITTSYVEDELEMKERTHSFVYRVLADVENRNVAKYGIKVELETQQLPRTQVNTGFPEGKTFSKEEEGKINICFNSNCGSHNDLEDSNCESYTDVTGCDVVMLKVEEKKDVS